MVGKGGGVPATLCLLLSLPGFQACFSHLLPFIDSFLSLLASLQLQIPGCHRPCASPATEAAKEF